jgi:hypothetical protein
MRTEFEKLEDKVDRLTDSIVILVDTIKLLTYKIYGGESPESAQEILNRANEMVEKWED